jgi:hypothetical protein
MKLITEEVVDVNYLAEEVDGVKNYFIQGIFLQANKKNRNGRYYPKELLQREVARYNSEYISRNRALGELGHPDTPTVNLDRASHRIISLIEDGNNFIGRAKVMDTPNGRILKTLIDEKVTLGVSSRGLGSLKKVQDMNLVQNDFHLSTAADVVLDPSAQDAFIQGIMEGKQWANDAYVQGIMEGKEWVMENGIIKEVNSEALMESVSRGDYEAKALAQFSDFLSKL